MTRGFWSSCLHLPDAEIIGLCLHSQLIRCWGSKLNACSACALPTELHLQPSPFSKFFLWDASQVAPAELRLTMQLGMALVVVGRPFPRTVPASAGLHRVSNRNTGWRWTSCSLNLCSEAAIHSSLFLILQYFISSFPHPSLLLIPPSSLWTRVGYRRQLKGLEEIGMTWQPVPGTEPGHMEELESLPSSVPTQRTPFSCGT